MTRRNKRKKNKLNSIFSGSAFKWYLFIIAIIVVLIFVTGGHGTLQLVKVKLEKNKLEQKKVELSKENIKLKNFKDSLKSNPEAVEKIAREKYNMAKPGEDIYQVEPEK